ncbi:EspA/EspE family type VII secretion system effector [Mycolicibacterium sp. XJ2546]
MSAIDAFYAVWTNARDTFGQGTPQDGAPFDDGAALRRLGSDVASAAPGSVWSGDAASAYNAKNTGHRR